jgi:hypothetical protein
MLEISGSAPPLGNPANMPICELKTWMDVGCVGHVLHKELVDHTIPPAPTWMLLFFTSQQVCRASCKQVLAEVCRCHATGQQESFTYNSFSLPEI